MSDPEVSQALLMEVELLKQDHNNTKAMTEGLIDQSKETLKGMNDLSERISSLVTVIEVKTANDEHIKSEVEAVRVEIKEVYTELKQWKDFSGPIVRKAKESQELKTTMFKAMASNTGKIIITLMVAGIIFVAAQTFGLSIEKN
jgi:chaperonin cofactor prefoldin